MGISAIAIASKIMRQPPYSINATHSRQTAQGFLDLAERAERGELIGGGYVAIYYDRVVVVGTLGYAMRNPDICLRGAVRLMNALAHDPGLD